MNRPALRLAAMGAGGLLVACGIALVSSGPETPPSTSAPSTAAASESPDPPASMRALLRRLRFHREYGGAGVPISPSDPVLRQILAMPPEESVPRLAELLGAPADAIPATPPAPAPKPALLRWKDYLLSFFTGAVVHAGPPLRMPPPPPTAKAAYVLALIGPRAASAKPALLASLDTADHEAMWEVLAALDSIGLPDDELAAACFPLIERSGVGLVALDFLHARRRAAAETAFDLWRAIAQTPDHPARARALEHLREMKVPAADREAIFRQAVGDGDFTARLHAFEGLAELEGGLSGEVRRAAVEQLGTSPPNSAYKSWHQNMRLAAARLLARRSPEDRALAIETLHKLSDAPPISITDDQTFEDFRLMWKARIEWQRHEPDALDLDAALTEELRSPASARLLPAVEAALALDAAQTHKMVPLLTTIAQQRGYATWKTAVDLLATIGPPARSSLPVLRELYRTHRDGRGRLLSAIAAIENVPVDEVNVPDNTLGGEP